MNVNTGGMTPITVFTIPDFTNDEVAAWMAILLANQLDQPVKVVYRGTVFDVKPDDTMHYLPLSAMMRHYVEGSELAERVMDEKYPYLRSHGSFDDEEPSPTNPPHAGDTLGSEWQVG